ncbi:MAG: hypothetical protein JST92_15630 [Deltaproteobacteria bacterium]|nr:hypothetical protein [Deltaproteobacteria bacterium]
MRRHLPLLALLLPILVGVVGACGNDKIRRAGEQVEVVSGTPTVGTGLPGVDRADAGADGGQFGSAAPFQVDNFAQQSVQKVDILWVIDNSTSMQAKQNRVKDNFLSFMQFLTQQHIDYHLGVVTTDTYDPAQSGRLVNLAKLPKPWIDSSAADPKSAFVANASVGTSGSGDEKPLLGAMLALTPPLPPATPASTAGNCEAVSDGGTECFIRQDAPLYTIIVSDEEDSSCSPISNAEGCDNAQATLSGYGSIEYWSRFFSGIKGLGGTSRVAAIVANESDTHDCGQAFGSYCDLYQVNTKCAGAQPDCHLSSNGSNPCCAALKACHDDLFDKAQYCFLNLVPQSGPTTSYTITGSWPGCIARDTDGGVAFTGYSADRTTKVAQATGGIATSICDADYTPALAKLGLQASGLRSDFPLSRAPLAGAVDVRVDGAEVAQGAGTWSYVKCENHLPANVVRFVTPPVPGSKVTVSYNVDVRGLGACP